MEIQQCRSSNCRADVVWAINDATGKKVILDAEPVAGGNIVQTQLIPGGELHVRHLTRGEDPPAMAPRYQSHFASCPDADKFRKKKG